MYEPVDAAIPRCRTPTRSKGTSRIGATSYGKRSIEVQTAVTGTEPITHATRCGDDPGGWSKVGFDSMPWPKLRHVRRLTAGGMKRGASGYLIRRNHPN
jgi:hypothetical protein